MSKEKDYGFKTPVRRTTNNITGNKVGGQYSGAYCNIIKTKAVQVEEKVVFKFQLNSDDAPLLFTKELSIVAIGGYFLADKDTSITLSIEIEGVETNRTFLLTAGNYEKIGLEKSFSLNAIETTTPISLSVSLESDNSTVQYTELSFGFVEYEYLINNDVYAEFYNSKKIICFPEQFYFMEEIELPDSIEHGVTITKSCNRCQRFLPINHINERNQLAFSNHCSTKAPCTHSGFSKYQIVKSDLNDEELTNFLETTPYTLNDDKLLISYYGHQLECKACKKFFVNAPLNPLRSSTQHREDSLRRRAFERLIGILLESKWIYHSFREENNKEFDVYVWEKFGKKCFNCKVDLPTAKDMDLDHTMPLSYLYPLDITATCLCPTCNSSKSDMFPVDFYKEEQLAELAGLTGIDIDLLSSRLANQSVVDLIRDKLVWFFEEFLTFDEYVKERDGKRVSDSILHSLQKVINHTPEPYDLIEEYKKTINT